MRKRQLIPLLIASIFVGAGCTQQANVQVRQTERKSPSAVEADVNAIVSDVSSEDALNEQEADDAADVTSDKQEITTYGSADYEIK